MRYQEVFPVPVEWLDTVDTTIAETVAGWAEREVASRRLEHGEDSEGLLLPALRKLFADIGLASMMIPERLGGGGLDRAEVAMTACAALEAAGTADTGIAFALANTLAFQSSFALEPGSDEALLERLAQDFTGGEPAVCSLVLPAYAGAADADRGLWSGLSYQVSGAPDTDGFLLEGAGVRPQCCGASAAMFGIAFDDGSGPALAIAGRGAEGLSAGTEFRKTGLAVSDNAELNLQGVRVPQEDVASRGDEAFRAVLSRYYAFCGSIVSGALLATYEILKEWGDTRVIKGKGQIFKENPLAASVMGEVGGNIARSRMLVYSLARMLSKPDIYGAAGSESMYASATATFKGVTASAMRAMDATMELMGSAGYATEWNLERYWRDVKTLGAYVVPETVALIDMARHYFGLGKL